MEWLSAYIDLDGVGAEDLAKVLTDAGIEVEGIEQRGGGEVHGVVAGLVVACEPHPNADKLKVCQVDVGQEAPLTIVCGAENVTMGVKVPVALPGSMLPGGPIGKAKLRGIESNGMLCSAKEIGLETRLLPKDQTSGLYILPTQTRVGADVAELLALDDWILDVSLTPNRSDCLSLRGLVYEIGALLTRPVRFPEEAGPTVAPESEAPVRVQIESPNCTRYEAQVFEQVQVGESPLWMQMRLLAMGIRPISNIVDITNYVMLEWGQPLHAFDLDEVQGGIIVVRQGTQGEQLITLDGETRDVGLETLLIADASRAIGIAGVMGGQNSEISDQTRHVVLESAQFNPTSVRRTGQRLGLRSEAQQRFEKGIDPVAVHGAMLRATELLVSVCGAVPVGPVVTEIKEPSEEAGRAIEFSPKRANDLLGTEIPSHGMETIFERLRFGITKPLANSQSDEDQGQEATWLVSVPSRRPDITREADLIEEVARLHGYEVIPDSLPVGPTTVGARNPSQRLRSLSRSWLAAQGLFEVFTYTFTHERTLDALRLSTDSELRRMVPLLHPMSEERTVLRTHLLPGLAEVAVHNLSHGQSGGQIFEIGRVYLPSSLPITEIPNERLMLGALWFGDIERSLGNRRRPYDFFDAKGVIESWLTALGVQQLGEYTRAEEPWYHPGRSAVVSLCGVKIGSLGQLHPETANAFGLGTAIYAEFDLELVLQSLASDIRVQRLPRYPAIVRDLAVLVPSAVAAGDLVREANVVMAEGYGDSSLEECRVFDVYAGKGVPDGKKSIAVSFVYRLADRTMTDAEVNEREACVIDRWQVKFNAELRAGF